MYHIRNIILFFFAPLTLTGQTPEKVENESFLPGESLTYQVYYQSNITGKLNAGQGYLQVNQTYKTFENREVLRYSAFGASKGIINLFIKVREHFESYADSETFRPYYFERISKEGNYEKSDTVVFDYQNMIARSLFDTIPIKPMFHDIISIFYYARTLNVDTLNVGDMLHLEYFIDDSIYVSAIQYSGKKVIKTKYGTFRCMGFRPEVAVGPVFSEPYPAILWVTDDKNKIPVLAESEVWLGHVKLELIEATGIRNEETARVDE
jgi:hypothetical protein